MIHHCKARPKLTPDQVRKLRMVNDERMELLSRLNNLPSIEKLACQFGVTKSAAQKAAIGLTHKDIR